MENDNKKKMELDDIFTCMGAGGFLAMILFGIISLFVPNIFLLCLVIIACIVAISGVIGVVIENKKDKDKHIANKVSFQQEYDKYISKIGIVESDMQATLIELNKYNLHSSIPQYLWVENETLKIFPMSKYYIQNCTSSVSKPNISELQLKSVSIDSILYFEEVGELRKYTKMSGGGTSLKGALLGYVIADDVGAIIGSREPIKSEVITEDDRRIELIYKNQNNEVANLEFEHDAYEVLKRLIPSKELRRIAALSTIEAENGRMDANIHKPQSTKEKLKQINDLKNEGLITEEEFQEQKRKILNTL